MSSENEPDAPASRAPAESTGAPTTDSATTAVQDDATLAALIEDALPPVRLAPPLRDDLGRRLRLQVARFGERRQAGLWAYLWYLVRENEAGAVWTVMAAGLSRFLHLGGGDHPPDDEPRPDDDDDPGGASSAPPG